MSTPILTTADGRPIERPVSPGPNSTSEQKAAYMRAVWAYNDRVADVANAAFTEGFRKGLRKHK